mmetsp:Transcript_6887/g.15585  ORF Transcript_6887/g.15585 Transcript_6887/m.15585 type:complete len:640 (+) Transcript_6887:56-1975(+)
MRSQALPQARSTSRNKARPAQGGYAQRFGFQPSVRDDSTPTVRAALRSTAAPRLERNLTDQGRPGSGRAAGTDFGMTAQLAAAPKVEVVVRKRPLNRKELAQNQQDVLDARGSSCHVKEPKVKVDLTKFTEEHVFTFDACFDETVDNERLYQAAVRPLVEAACQGGKCTCFAYGQTGSGKTHTMMGPAVRDSDYATTAERSPGLFLLAAKDLFGNLQRPELQQLQIVISFYEIYCGKLFDLLNSRKLLHARENAKGQVVIVGLQEVPLENVQQLMGVIEYGLRERTTGCTGANVDSSRSHAILQICLKDTQKGRVHGKFSFIDLAGSERGADVTETDRQTRMDGAEINKSLLALKECIRALDQQQDHTPFRGSKLTQVLKDSLVGDNCRTLMIANLSPSAGSVEHSLNTLRYAYRVKELRRGSVSNEAVKLDRREPISDSPDLSSDGLSDDTPEDSPVLVASIAAPLSQGVEEVAAVQVPPTGGTGGPAVSSGTAPSGGTGGVPAVALTAAARPLKEDVKPVPAPEEVPNEQAAWDDMAQAHDRLIGTILAEEEALIATHRKHIDQMVELIKEEMTHLNNVDRPGSDVDAYVKNLDKILDTKASFVEELRGRLKVFQGHLADEESLSQQFQARQMVSPG